MDLGAVCTAAIIANGILMNGDEPASASILQSPNLTVALLGFEDDFDQTTTHQLLSTINKDALVDLISYLHHKGELDLLDNTYYFPENMEKITAQAIGQWYKGDISIVDKSEKPDVLIYAYAGLSPHSSLGFGGFPENTHDRENHSSYEGDTVIIGLNTFKLEDPDYLGKQIFGEGYTSKYTGVPFSETVYKALGHEAGHSIAGIVHFEDAVKLSEDQCEIDSEAIIEHFSQANMAGGNSSDGAHENTFYEEGILRELEKFSPANAN